MTRHQRRILHIVIIGLLATSIGQVTHAAKTWPIDLANIPADEAICFALYTVHDSVLKMTAQLYPLADGIDRTVILQIGHDGSWRDIARTKVSEEPYGWPQKNIKRWKAQLRIENGDAKHDQK